MARAVLRKLEATGATRVYCCSGSRPGGVGALALRWSVVLSRPQAPIQGGLKFPTSKRRRSKMRPEPFSARSTTAQSR